jgi:hypothetical protein
MQWSDRGRAEKYEETRYEANGRQPRCGHMSDLAKWDRIVKAAGIKGD